MNRQEQVLMSGRCSLQVDGQGLLFAVVWKGRDLFRLDSEHPPPLLLYFLSPTLTNQSHSKILSPRPIILFYFRSYV